MKTQLKNLAVAAGALVVTGAANAATTTIDYSSIGTGITGEMAAAIAAGVVVAAFVLAPKLGWKVFKGFGNK